MSNFKNKKTFKLIFQHSKITKIIFQKKNYQKIKNFSQKINIDSYEKLNELCIYLINPCEKFNIKIMDKLTDALNIIYQNDLKIPEKILQEMNENLLKFLSIYFQSNPEDSIEIKILNTMKIMYFNKKIFLHNQNLKYVIIFNDEIKLITSNLHSKKYWKFF